MKWACKKANFMLFFSPYHIRAIVSQPFWKVYLLKRREIEVKKWLILLWSLIVRGVEQE